MTNFAEVLSKASTKQSKPAIVKIYFKLINLLSLSNPNFAANPIYLTFLMKGAQGQRKLLQILYSSLIQYTLKSRPLLTLTLDITRRNVSCSSYLSFLSQVALIYCHKMPSSPNSSGAAFLSLLHTLPSVALPFLKVFLRTQQHCPS